MSPKRREEIRQALVALAAVIPRCLPDNADRRKMWERIPSVLEAGGGSEDSWGKLIESVTRRLSLDRARLLATKEAASVISAGNAWSDDDVTEALRQLHEESTLIAALARVAWEEKKAAAAAERESA